VYRDVRLLYDREKPGQGKEAGITMSQPSYHSLFPLFEELHDERISVRPYQESDAQAVYEAIGESRDHIRPWMEFADKHQTVEETRDWLNVTRSAWILRSEMTTGIWERATGRLLGTLSLHPRDWEIGYFEIGYWLRASAEGHGYLTAAGCLVVEYAFTELNAQRLEIRCNAKNTRSAAVARRLGFVQEGCLRNDSTTPDGSLRSTLIFGLILVDRAQ
jgi:ribosomal-protein-serine acetyltransferase